MSDCDKCGEWLVFPKCTPLIEHTNSLVVRHKDTDYNGGYPNSLNIVPVYTHPSSGHISVAILTGDNFHEGFTYYGARSVEEMAKFLATCDVEDIIQMFNLKRGQKRAATDLLTQLKNYLKVGEMNEPTNQ